MFRTSLLTVLLVLTTSASASAQSGVLTHGEVMTRAVDNNLALLVDSMAREIEALRAREARRAYTPVVFLQPEFIASQTAVRTSETEEPAILRQSRFDVGGGVRWNTPWGTSLALRAATTPWYSTFAPTPLTSAELSVNQSLLRNGWGSANLLDVADLDVELQRQLFVGQLNTLLTRVDAAYWELAYAQADVEIKEKSRDRAQSQYEDTKENIARGLLAPGDIFVVEENLVIFEEQLLRSQEALVLARLRLARLMQLESHATELAAADSLDALQTELPTEQDAIGVALRESPRVTAQRIAVRQAEATLAFDRNQSRPVLDVSAALGVNGLSEQFGESWGETLGGDNPTVRVGLYFEVPLVSGPYRARVVRSGLQREQAELQLQQIESDVAYDVRELLTQLESRIAALDFAKRRIDLAENKLATERDKYTRGLSTLTDLVRFQRDVDAARISERRARVDVIVLRARLLDTQGVLHRAVGVEVR